MHIAGKGLRQLQSKPALKRPSLEPALAATGTAISHVLAVKVRWDTDSSPLRWGAPAPDCQDLGKELHFVPGFPDLPCGLHIMIIK